MMIKNSDPLPFDPVRFERCDFYGAEINGRVATLIDGAKKDKSQVSTEPCPTGGEAG